MKGLLLLPASLAALFSTSPVSSPSTHAAVVSGSMNANLAGPAVFGPVQGARSCVAGGCSASFSLELGAYSGQGAVVFSRVSGDRPRVGTYEVAPFGPGAESDDEFHALVSLGSAEAPTGVFRAMRGRVTITQSTAQRIVGRYEVRAVGFLAADLDNEGREITVRGQFTAEPAPAASMYEATLHGAVRTTSRGAAEFGVVGAKSERAFSLSLGAYSEQAAILLSRIGGERPAVGVYQVQEVEKASQGDFYGLVITGSPERPTAVFRARRGSVTITASSPDRLTGTFELHGVGYLASTLEDESQEVVVSGSFSATAHGTPLTLTVR